MLFGVGPTATGRKMSWPEQFMAGKQPWVAVGRLVNELKSVVNVVAMVPVIVDEATRVVGTTTVPIVLTTVVPAVDVAIIEPSLVIVVGNTVTCVSSAVVSTGTFVTVDVVTTVSNVDSGKVTVTV
jgi:hypothetical protein